MELSLVEDVLHSPGGLWTIARHADSENRNLSKRASMSPPTGIISLSVLGSHKEMFTHPTGWAVSGGLCL